MNTPTTDVCTDCRGLGFVSAYDCGCTPPCGCKDPCPACGGSGALHPHHCVHGKQEEVIADLSDRLEDLEQRIWALHGLPNVREEPGGEHVKPIRYCGECKRRWPCPTVQCVNPSQVTS